MIVIPEDERIPVSKVPEPTVDPKFVQMAAGEMQREGIIPQGGFSATREQMFSTTPTAQQRGFADRQTDEEKWVEMTKQQTQKEFDNWMKERDRQLYGDQPVGMQYSNRWAGYVNKLTNEQRYKSGAEEDTHFEQSRIRSLSRERGI